MSKQTRQQRIVKFWAGTKISDLLACWEWQRGKYGAKGYGCFYFDGKTRQAHRVAWTIVYGDIPTGMWVLHKCDNPACCNPNHLYLGTAKDNMRDSVERGRRPTRYNQPIEGSYRARKRNKGQEYHFKSKLSEADVIRIRELLSEGRTGMSLAKQYGVCRQNIHNIKHRRTWAHLP